MELLAWELRRPNAVTWGLLMIGPPNYRGVMTGLARGVARPLVVVRPRLPGVRLPRVPVPHHRAAPPDRADQGPALRAVRLRACRRGRRRGGTRHARGLAGAGRGALRRGGWRWLQ